MRQTKCHQNLVASVLPMQKDWAVSVERILVRMQLNAIEQSMAKLLTLAAQRLTLLQPLYARVPLAFIILYFGRQQTKCQHLDHSFFHGSQIACRKICSLQKANVEIQSSRSV